MSLAALRAEPMVVRPSAEIATPSRQVALCRAVPRRVGRLPPACCSLRAWDVRKQQRTSSWQRAVGQGR